MSGFGDLFGALGELFGGLAENAETVVPIVEAAGDRGEGERSRTETYDRILVGAKRELNINDN